MMNLAPITIYQIKNSNWQLSNLNFGQVAQGSDDIIMCIQNILYTQKGECPLDPEFGTLLREAIDMPINSVAPFVVNEVINSIGQFEKRVFVESVSQSLSSDFKKITFTISMSVVANASPLGYTFELINDKNNGRAFSDGFLTVNFG